MQWINYFSKLVFNYCKQFRSLLQIFSAANLHFTLCVSRQRIYQPKQELLNLQFMYLNLSVGFIVIDSGCNQGWVWAFTVQNKWSKKNSCYQHSFYCRTLLQTLMEMFHYQETAHPFGLMYISLHKSLALNHALHLVYLEAKYL